MADENRKNRIKELLKMSDYVPSILIETRKEGLEEGIKKGESIRLYSKNNSLFPFRY